MIRHEYGMDYSISFHRISVADSDLLKDFHCGNPAIEQFIHEESLFAGKDVTYLFIDTENQSIIGFCSICCSGISCVEEDTEKKLFTTIIPAIEIDYFAIDEEYRSLRLDKDSNRYETLSQSLFLFMIHKIEEITHTVVGATHICLYAVPQAVSFYKRCGFCEFSPYMNRDELPFLDGCIPMFYTI